VLPQRRQALLARRQAVAVEHAHPPARQDGAAVHRRGHRRQALGAAAHQGAQDGRLGVVDLVVSSREYWRWRCASNTASIPLDALASGHPAGNACSSAVRAITLPAHAAQTVL